jgi:uncharacterized protein YxjI
MRYPLQLRFKIAAIASQIYAADADGNELFYIKQKLFKLKENIEVYSDRTKQTRLFTVKADRVIDFSPLFTMTDESGRELGTVKRFGRASIWKARYGLTLGSREFNVEEANAWIKVADALIGEIPIVGIISSYLFHPKYVVTDGQGNAVATLHKRPAFFEGKYLMDGSGVEALDDHDQHLFAVLMTVVVLRERMRG